MPIDLEKLKRFFLWFIPWVLWGIAIVRMTAPVLGTKKGNTIIFDGPQFVAWIMVVVALLRAIDIWITQVVRGLVSDKPDNY